MKLIIFDCDGTLVDSEVIATRVFTSFWATHGVHIADDEFKLRFIGKGNSHPDNIDLFEKMPPHAYEEGDRLLDEALEKDLEAVKGMNELLSGLTKKLCVSSNSRLSYVKAALQKTNLHEYFGERVFSAKDRPNPKPAPDLFLHIAKVLEVPPKDCIVIEDSPSGVKGAQNAGMPVIGFTGAAHFIPELEERLQKTKPDWLCSTTDELKSLLKQFEVR